MRCVNDLEKFITNGEYCIEYRGLNMEHRSDWPYR